MIKKIWVLTLFPEYFFPLVSCGITGQALRGERSQEIKFEINLVNIRDYSFNKYKSIDDTPYGGGPGMVMRADVLKEALFKGVIAKGEYQGTSDLHIIYTSPRGKPWDNKAAQNFSSEYLGNAQGPDIVFICGRYEGVDERFLQKYVHDFFSIGDYVLTGGEIAVMAMLDSAIRFVPGILGNKLSSVEDSFEDGLIEYPQYTRPSVFEGEKVPDVLLSGHHQNINTWHEEQKKIMTKKYRPDLFKTKCIFPRMCRFDDG